MRKNLFLVLALFAVCCVSAQAEVTVQQTTDAEYMINGGYSEAAAEEVLIQKNRSAGTACETLYENNNNKFTGFFKNCFSYIDPARDSEERYHHDIHQSPSWHDL